MLLEAIERLGGEKFTIEKVNTDELIKERQAAVVSGDPYAVYSLIETGFVTGRFGGHLEKEGQIMNDLLGLPKKNLDEVVKAALKAVSES